MLIRTDRGEGVQEGRDYITPVDLANILWPGRPVDIRDFSGADPTGTHDNRSIFATAISQAVSSKVWTVLVPAGYYIIDTAGGTISIPEGCSLIGPGSGFQVRAPTTSIQGTMIGIVGTVNSPFGINRGSRVADMTFYWPEQPVNAATPTEYPWLFTNGAVGSGSGRSDIENLRLLNCDKFLKNGDSATGLNGGGMFVRNVKGMVFREFIRQENANAFSQVTECATSATFAPFTSTLSQVFIGANLIFLALDGDCDGLKVSNCLGFRGGSIIRLTNASAISGAKMNFTQLNNCVFDGWSKGYSTDGAICPLSLQVNDNFIGLANVDDLVSAPIAFDFTSPTASGLGTERTVSFIGNRFRGARGNMIKIGASTTGVDMLHMKGNTIIDWATGSGVAVDTPCILIDRATCRAHISDYLEALQSGTKIGIRLAAFDRADLIGTHVNDANKGISVGAGNELNLLANITSESTTKGAELTGVVTTIKSKANSWDSTDAGLDNA